MQNSHCLLGLSTFTWSNSLFLAVILTCIWLKIDQCSITKVKIWKPCANPRPQPFWKTPPKRVTCPGIPSIESTCLRLFEVFEVIWGVQRSSFKVNNPLNAFCVGLSESTIRVFPSVLFRARVKWHNYLWSTKLYWTLEKWPNVGSTIVIESWKLHSRRCFSCLCAGGADDISGEDD